MKSSLTILMVLSFAGILACSESKKDSGDKSEGDDEKESKEGASKSSESKRVSIGARIPAEYTGEHVNGAYKTNRDPQWRNIYISSSAIVGRLFHDGGLVPVTTLSNVRGTVKGGVFSWTADGDCHGTMEPSDKSLILSINCKEDGKDKSVNVDVIPYAAPKKLADTEAGKVDPFDREIQGDDPIPEVYRAKWTNNNVVRSTRDASWWPVVISSSAITGRLFWGGMTPATTVGGIKGKTVDGRYFFRGSKGCTGMIENRFAAGYKPHDFITLSCPKEVLNSDKDKTIIISMRKGSTAAPSVKAEVKGDPNAGMPKGLQGVWKAKKSENGWCKGLKLTITSGNIVTQGKLTGKGKRGLKKAGCTPRSAYFCKFQHTVKTVAVDGPIVKAETGQNRYYQNRTFTRDGDKKVDIAGWTHCWQGINGTYKKSK